jgi:hypothetical protein
MTHYNNSGTIDSLPETQDIEKRAKEETDKLMKDMVSAMFRRFLEPCTEHEEAINEEYELRDLEREYANIDLLELLGMIGDNWIE